MVVFVKDRLSVQRLRKTIGTAVILTIVLSMSFKDPLLLISKWTILRAQKHSRNSHDANIFYDATNGLMVRSFELEQTVSGCLEQQPEWLFES